MNFFTKFLCCLALTTALIAQDKSALDLDFPDSPPGGLAKIANSDYGKLENAQTGISLTADGYFTFGITGGDAQEWIDDGCQLTFGHPYALTSYPFFSLDGEFLHPETFFYGETRWLNIESDSLLRLISTDSASICMIFDVGMLPSQNAVYLSLTIENLDTVSHDIGLGMMLDPAIGKWGDGAANIAGSWYDEETTIQSAGISGFEIWERRLAPKGIGLATQFGSDAPNSLQLDNWFDFHQSQGIALSGIFDLAIKMNWDAAPLAAGESRTATLTFTLLQPEFSDGLFLRSDLPQFLSIENNLIFPRTVKPLVQIYNNGSQAAGNVQVSLTSPVLVDAWESNTLLTIPAGESAFDRATVKVPEVYEDRGTTLILQALDDGQSIAEMLRQLYVPAAPLSDSGLVVTIDSVITGEFPIVKLNFRAEEEATGRLLLDLQEENIFLYEDQQRITDFVIGKDTTGGVNEADIVFVLDVTGSMGDEINGVKNNITEFADSLSARGIDFRLGMVTFLDIIENVYDFTTDVQLFQSYVAAQFAHGGGDRKENSLDALSRAAQFDFRPAANRVFIWITDADYHEANNITQLTKEEVVTEMLAKGIAVHNIGNPTFQVDWYEPITIPTGGLYFDIYGNFRDILLELSRLPGTSVFQLSYESDGTTGVPHDVELEIHYAGLGGSATVNFTPPTANAEAAVQATVTCFPNPFNPIANINIFNPLQKRGELTIYNVLGQRIRTVRFGEGQTQFKFIWNGENDRNNPVSNGIYFLSVKLIDTRNQTETLPAVKLIYAK